MKSLLSCVVLIAICLGAGPVCCTRPDEARRVLAAQGYTEVVPTGYRYFQGDAFVTGFRAKTQAGVVVTGSVTSGFFKGATVRID